MRFHPLAVADVEELTDDAAAVTFTVPPELAEAYAFDAGQCVTLRRVVEGEEHRRTYSICAPVGSPLRIGVREIPDGLFSRWLVHDVRPGIEIEVLDTPGHTRDSVCFVVECGNDRAVFTGDTILGRGTTVVAWPDGDLGGYLASLERLLAYEGVRVLPVTRFEHYLIFYVPAGKSIHVIRALHAARDFPTIFN